MILNLDIVHFVLVHEMTLVYVGVSAAELRSSGLASPVHSSLSRRSNTSSSGHAMIPRTSSMHDLLEHRVAVRMQSMPAAHAVGKIYRSG